LVGGQHDREGPEGRKSVSEDTREEGDMQSRTLSPNASLGDALLGASGAGNLLGVTPRRGLARLRYRLLLGLLLVVVGPSVLFNITELSTIWSSPFGANTVLASCAALLIMLAFLRRAETLPGVGVISQVATTAMIAFGTVMTIMFAFRLGYSRGIFFGSFVGGLLFCFMLGLRSRASMGQAFHLIASPATCRLEEVPGIQWVRLSRPELPKDPHAVLIVDLREDFDDEWERLIATAAVKGIPVYHAKQVIESLTGRVEIEHLSENSFGSLIPNHGFNKVKRGIDFVLALLAFPFILLIGIVVGIVIKMQSPGPILFRQVRRGYKGEPFTVLKFRTMKNIVVSAEEMRLAAITKTGDPRITRFGAFLRRTRIDELPQVWNILRGEMSWIGPRPEAISLSDWYMGELPFYSYRHIVRPGITGWAQVNQGHVADIDSVYVKLHYDFYYIKYLSAGLDFLIVAKTFKTIFNGFGAK
jgi:lipopolysaccharide/colanic/teichoic acid biosynthesis glycosyltransferase